MYRDLGRPVKDSKKVLEIEKKSGLEVKKRRKKTKKNSHNICGNKMPTRCNRGL